MRNRINKAKKAETSYDLSISDLMAALSCVFLLFLAITIIELNHQKAKYEEKNGRAGEYIDMQKDLKIALEKEFQNDFKPDRWNAYISDDLTIHFRDEEIMFAPNSTELTEKFKTILDDFFPRLINQIADEKFRDNILEIRIEGHTARDPKYSAEEDYERGMYTSQTRTANVLFYCLHNTHLLTDKIGNEDSNSWVRKRIAAIGYSSSLPVLNSDGEIDLNSSRRVEIKIRTKSENVIFDINNL